MEQTRHARTWQSVEAGLLGAIIALSPLGGYILPAPSPALKSFAPMLVGLLVLLGLGMLGWFLTRVKATSRVAVVQVSCLVLASAAIALLLLINVPPSSIALYGGVGLVCGLVIVAAGGAAWLDALWAIAGLAGFWAAWFVTVKSGLSLGGALRAAALGLAGSFVTSLLTNRWRTSRIVRLWGYAILASTVWLSPLIRSLGRLTLSWSIPALTWLVAIAAACALGVLAHLFETRWVPQLWAMPSLNRLRQETADAHLAGERFSQAITHYREAQWASPTNAHAQTREAYALLRLGQLDEARSTAQFQIDYLLQEFSEGTGRQRPISLTLLALLNQTDLLLEDPVAGRRLLDALDDPDQELNSLTRRVLVEAGDKALSLLFVGMDHTSRRVRDFAVRCLLMLGLSPQIEQELSRRVAAVATPVILGVVQTILAPSARAWGALGEQIARWGGAGGLGALADATGKRGLRTRANEFWDSLHGPLFRRLLDALWEEDLSLACQAVELAAHLEPGFIASQVEKVKSGPLADSHPVANRLARIALLGQDVPDLQLLPTVGSPSEEIHIEMTPQARYIGCSHPVPSEDPPTADRATALPIPVLDLGNGERLLLLVVGLEYAARIESVPLSQPALMGFSIRTNHVPVQPSFYQQQELRKGQFVNLAYSLVPDQVGPDRLTVSIRVDGRDIGRPIKHPVFVCDDIVLKGLRRA